MSEGHGFSYFVSDEQLVLFARLSDFERLQWLDEARIFALLARTAETAERQERLRQGLSIVPDLAEANQRASR